MEKTNVGLWQQSKEIRRLLWGIVASLAAIAGVVEIVIGVFYAELGRDIQWGTYRIVAGFALAWMAKHVEKSVSQKGKQ